MNGCKPAGPTYYHTKSGVQQDDFGPVVATDDPKVAGNELTQRVCSGDPYLLAALITAHREGVTQQAVVDAQKLADGWLTHKDQWYQALADFAASLDPTRADVTRDDGTPYSTLGMDTGTGGRLVLKYDPKVTRSGRTFRLYFQDGTTLSMEEDCGFQPKAPLQSTPVGPTTPQPSSAPVCSNNCGGTPPPPCCTHTTTAPPPHSTTSCGNCYTPPPPPPHSTTTAPPPPHSTTPPTIPPKDGLSAPPPASASAPPGSNPSDVDTNPGCADYNPDGTCKK